MYVSGWTLKLEIGKVGHNQFQTLSVNKLADSVELGPKNVMALHSSYAFQLILI